MHLFSDTASQELLPLSLSPFIWAEMTEPPLFSPPPPPPPFSAKRRRSHRSSFRYDRRRCGKKKWVECKIGDRFFFPLKKKKLMFIRKRYFLIYTKRSSSFFFPFLNCFPTPCLTFLLLQKKILIPFSWLQQEGRYTKPSSFFYYSFFS